ncbi:hypothetical protein DID80_00735 [Candidatus Marinamargulisbacteria bacterium SCGC AAA071-K20]|nr:hypothetical protein DID80_00735 [Candidatus Marinamargulisbacteria bacterium SCGC AAA071-K20]
MSFKLIEFALVLILYLGTLVYGYSGVNTGLPISELMNPINRNGIKDEQAIEQMQTMFIKKLFTDQLMKTQSVIFDEDDEEFMSNKAQNDMMNDMMSYQLARQLAKQDIMNLKPLFEQQGWIREK